MVHVDHLRLLHHHRLLIHLLLWHRGGHLQHESNGQRETGKYIDIQRESRRCSWCAQRAGPVSCEPGLAGSSAPARGKSSPARHRPAQRPGTRRRSGPGSAPPCPARLPQGRSQPSADAPASPAASPVPSATAAGTATAAADIAVLAVPGKPAAGTAAAAAPARSPGAAPLRARRPAGPLPPPGPEPPAARRTPAAALRTPAAPTSSLPFSLFVLGLCLSGPSAA